MLRRTHSAALVVVTLLVAPGGLYAQELDDARALAQSGQYEEALALLPPAALSRTTTAERLLRAEILATLGRLDEATDALEDDAVGRHPAAEATLFYAELLASRGRPSRAIALLDDVIERQPLLVRAYAVRGRLRLRLGRVDDATADLRVLVNAYESGLLSRPEEVALAAEAYHRLGEYEAANAAYARALELDPESIDARLGWAGLLLEKYRPDQALGLTDEILARNPRQPRALALRGRALRALERAPDTVAAEAEAALEINPDLPQAHELLAELALDDEQYDRALELLEPVVERDEARLEAMTLQAAAWFLADDRRHYRHAVRRVLDLNPGYAQLYVTVADFAGHVFRYDDALDLYRRALELDPDYAPAHLGLGIGLSRQGDDEAARTELERALELDPFNERAYRMIRFYDGALADYETVSSEHFRFRFHRRERRVLESVVPPLLEESYARLVERYGVSPTTPLFVEVFADAETFAARSVGLPHVGPHGICFGRLITARSPHSGELNWAEVLSHELSHAFTIEVSEARVPRWLAEGIAEWDTAWLRPEWQRESELALLSRLRDGALPSVARLNRAFVRVHDVDDVRAAYAQSALTVEFVTSGWGSQAPLEMLRLFGERRSLAEVITAVTGLDVPGFDAAFEGFVRERLGPLVTSFEPNLDEFRDEDALEALVAAHPESADAWAELAVARLQTRQLEGCETAVERALALDAHHPLATFVSGFLALRERRLAEARTLFEQILADGHDGYGLRVELAYLSRRQGRSTEALRHYERALAIYPHGVEPNLEMADIQLRAGENESAITALERAISIDESNYDAVTRLIDLLIAEDRDADASRACDQASQIDPFDGERQGICGRVAYRLGDWASARRRLELELVLGPEDAAETERLLAVIGTHVSETAPDAGGAGP